MKIEINVREVDDRAWFSVMELANVVNQLTGGWTDIIKVISDDNLSSTRYAGILRPAELRRKLDLNRSNAAKKD